MTDFGMDSQTSPYNDSVMAGRTPTREAPLFGQRLAAIRKARGLSQRQLADLLGTNREVVDYYERRATNPTLDLIHRVARALDVSVVDLLGFEASRPRGKPGPPSKLQTRLDKVKQLPRKEQEFVIKFLDTVLERAGVQ